MGYYKKKCKSFDCSGCHVCLTDSQSSTNKQIVVPVEPMNNYELDIAMGAVPPDMTYEEWREINKVATNALEVIEYGDNA